MLFRYWEGMEASTAVDKCESPVTASSASSIQKSVEEKSAITTTAQRGTRQARQARPSEAVLTKPVTDQKLHVPPITPSTTPSTTPISTPPSKRSSRVLSMVANWETVARPSVVVARINATEEKRPSVVERREQKRASVVERREEKRASVVERIEDKRPTIVERKEEKKPSIVEEKRPSVVTRVTTEEGIVRRRIASVTAATVADESKKEHIVPTIEAGEALADVLIASATVGTALKRSVSVGSRGIKVNQDGEDDSDDTSSEASISTTSTSSSPATTSLPIVGARPRPLSMGSGIDAVRKAWDKGNDEDEETPRAVVVC
ncbi:hypothetical protein BC829DRAFT_60335 [Chytridium lagenaria]|nr:hypothetical protein BC829DRAFT_60335 [Chytridium lagenaria]